jgi:capsular polysaccharide biosynthesis protein
MQNIKDASSFEIIEPAAELKPFDLWLSAAVPTPSGRFPAASLPARRLAPRSISSGCLCVDLGMLFRDDGSPVQETSYMAGHVKYPQSMHSRGPQLKDSRVRLAYNAGWRNYYHSLIQGMFSLWIFNTHFYDSTATYVFPGSSPHITQVIGLTGVAASQLTFAHKNANLAVGEAAWLPTSYGAYVFQPSRLLRTYGSDILQRLRVPDLPPLKLYVSRKDSKRRRMINEDILEAQLAARGFKIVTLSSLPLSEQFALFRAADVVVAPHGAGLSNLIFSRQGTRVIELSMSSYLNPCFAALGMALDLNYAMHVSLAHATSDYKHTQEWNCDVSSVIGRL